jgi:hypothetical protein
MYLDGLASCAELTTEHAVAASWSSAAMRSLLIWAARVARPRAGAPKVLMAIARLSGADWIEGTPFIEVTGTDAETKISIFADHGMGIRERVLPLAILRVPVEEFARAIRLAPQLIAPFQATQRGDTILLSPVETSLDETRESITIAESSLHEQERKTSPPTLPGTEPPESGVHTHPTVRRMVALSPEALRSGNDDD